MTMCGYRSLKESEVKVLVTNGCTSTDWSKVFCSGELSPERLRNVSFVGTVQIGEFNATLDVPGAGEMQCGVYNARLVNVTLGNNCLIENVRCISNYKVEDGVLISGCGNIITRNNATYGLGSEVCVLDETGGRSVMLSTGLSAQIAYLMAMYRHDAEMVKALEGKLESFDREYIGRQAVIGANSRIVGAEEIIDTYIDSDSLISGCKRLEAGVVLSCAEKPTKVGAGVIADNFVIQTAAIVADGVNIENCFVGQGVVLSRGFTGSHSLFFANSHFENGEAVSLFAGPFTVSHHKATLLIGVMTSFYNAGSGTNFSNHLYKLGPVHQGVLLRGVKSGSGSYMMHPVKVGAFSTVIGHHTEKMDTTDMPFSCILDEGGKTKVLPGINLKNIGLYRDIDKWGKRDKRAAENRVDVVTTEAFTPLTASAMLRGIKVLSSADVATSVDAVSAEKGVKLYKRSLKLYMAKALQNRVADVDNDVRLAEVLKPTCKYGAGQWVDIAGLIVPADVLSEFIASLKAGKYACVNCIQGAFNEMAMAYPEYEWAWIYNNFKLVFNIDLKSVSCADLNDVFDELKTISKDIAQDLEADARKEFAPKATVSFGVDALDAATVQDDIKAVRGTYEDSSLKSLIEKTFREDILA